MSSSCNNNHYLHHRTNYSRVCKDFAQFSQSPSCSIFVKLQKKKKFDPLIVGFLEFRVVQKVHNLWVTHMGHYGQIFLNFVSSLYKRFSTIFWTLWMNLVNEEDSLVEMSVRIGNNPRHEPNFF